MMKPVDAIEYVLRTHSGKGMEPKSLHRAVGELVFDGSFSLKDLEAVVTANPDRFFQDQAGAVQLRPTRLADRVGFFREHLLDLRDALRLMPFADSHWVELGLIYGLALRAAGKHPTMLQNEQVRWPMIDLLAQDFPEVGRQWELIVANGGIMVQAPLQRALALLGAVELSPLEYVLEMRSILAREKHMGQLCTPWPVATLMARLLGGGVQEVFDPAADASVIPAVLATDPHVPVKAEAIFSNRFAQFFTTLQARILGAQLVTSLNSQPATHDARLYAHCISAPPFGGRVKEEGSQRAVEPYVIAIERIIQRLAPGGKAVVLVPESMLFSIQRAPLRKKLMDLGLLHAVISLPAGSFAPITGVKASILVFERTGLPYTSVRFVDAALHIASRSPKALTLDVDSVLQASENIYAGPGVLDVKLSEIRSDEQLSLSLSRFASLLQQDRIVAEAEGTNVVELGSVIVDDILSLGDHAGLPLFQVTELSSDVLDMTRTARSGQLASGSERKGTKRLDVPALLLARVGGKLKPTLFDPVDGPIAVGSNVFMFRVDTDRADAEYLAIELRSPMVQDQLDAYHQGSTIASIAKADLLRIRVRLPELPEQIRVVRQRKEAILLAKKEEIARQEKQHGLSTDEWRILGAVEHSFRPVLALVEQPMDTIRALAGDLSDEKQAVLKAELVKIDAGLDRMRGLFKLINDVIRSDKDSLRPVPVDLRRLFRTEVRGLAQDLKNLRVYFQCEAGLDSPEGVIARVDPRQFALVIQNLFTNMAKHGRRPEQDDVTVLVQVNTRTEPGRTWLAITIENNGRPFASGFSHQDLVSFGKRLDTTNGNGIGGYLIDRIIANHNGRFSSCNLELDESSERSGFTKDQRLDENHWEPLDWEPVSINMSVQFKIELPIAYAEDHD